ncbi:Gfo/Idh/MocA family oxidoreductase [Pelagicoccus sp. SDUM812005]|uniref:Gfo/Idh/MocA family protein n=1 Tax=Pelagicoccus sp. SDUM812005 TaxID=3041257 RepID=UPI00280ECC9D|nr:Gfo/Idh/MocA family oxidoreductase [Pelagicoccus sp. SDUM812005]MDQ8181414.1 Gfo/Idh/MocA family oxidoreductase [Pelagicoccus sp. SDUM812005]
MKQLKCAVVGLGMGRHHVKAFHEHPDSTVVALVDLDEKRLKDIGDQHQIPNRYQSVDELFANEQLDIVSIATPNSLHKPVALQAFQHGAHVFCEKPVALNAREAEEMIAASQNADRRLMINFSFRFTPTSWALKQQVDSGAIGDVYAGRTRWLRRDGMPGFGGWFGKKSLAGGGPLIDLGVHRLDLALWLMGYPNPKYVLATTANTLGKQKADAAGKEFDVEDFASAQITFEKGVSLQVEASWMGHIKEETMETSLLGTRGGLSQNNIDGSYDFRSFLYTESQGSKLDIEIKGGTQGPPSGMHHFVDCISAGRPHTATAEEGLLVMKILDAIYLSAASGQPVSLA